MRNVEFYQSKLSESTTLADVEKFLSGGLKQLESDRETLKARRNRLLDEAKKLEDELAGFQTIEKEIVGLGQERIGQIMSQLAPTLPKKRGRKGKPQKSIK
ncbi:MAG: hypothetical protein ACOH5I_21810 [Oligoflexus sp.]